MIGGYEKDKVLSGYVYLCRQGGPRAVLCVTRLIQAADWV